MRRNWNAGLGDLGPDRGQRTGEAVVLLERETAHGTPGSGCVLLGGSFDPFYFDVVAVWVTWMVMRGSFILL